MTPPFFWSKIMNLLVFFDFEPKKCFRVPTLFGFVWGGVGRAGDLGDPVVPTLRGASGDVVTVYAYYDTDGRFLQSLALRRAVHNPCQRREMMVSTIMAS